MANTNLAYDLSIYAPKPKEQEKPEQPRLRVVKAKAKPRAFAAAFKPQIVATFALVVSLMSLIIYNQVCLNEVTGEISRLNQELAIMESESTRYASLLESTVSLRAVAQQAEEELGMTKLDQFQTKYVYLYEQDQIVLSEEYETTRENTGILASMGQAIKEYLGGS